MVKGNLVDEVDVRGFRGGLVFKAHRLSLNLRLESNKEEEEDVRGWCLCCCAGYVGRCRAKRENLKGFNDYDLKDKTRIWP